MRATANVLYLPEALSHQAEVLDAPARFKLWRGGRRVGKTRGDLIAALYGHGPIDPEGVPRFPGALHGADIVWVVPDYPQSRAIWREEILPRLANLPGVVIREAERRIEFTGLGSLEIRSAEAIDSVRGRRFDGAVLEESSFFDLEYVWEAVIRPALIDRAGWALFTSSPNAGLDGNSEKRAPSYFNRLCGRIDGLGPEWAHWRHRSDDNPLLSRDELATLRASYPPDSPTLAQEVDADLVAGGLMALTLSEERHRIRHDPEQPFTRAAHWPVFGGFDWGFQHPGVFGLFTTDGDGTTYLLDATSMQRLTPDSMCEQVRGVLERHGLTFADMTFTVAGHDCWHDLKARGERGPTIAEQCAARGWYFVRANISRVTGLNNLRDYLSADRFRIVDTMGTRGVWDCLASRISDPNNAEDVVKTDADVHGMGGDDGYDMVRYALMSRPFRAVAVGIPGHTDANVAPGYDYTKGARRPNRIESAVAQFKKEIRGQQEFRPRMPSIPRTPGTR